jgi:hypothetical protein
MAEIIRPTPLGVVGRVAKITHPDFAALSTGPHA